MFRGISEDVYVICEACTVCIHHMTEKKNHGHVEYVGRMRN